MSKLLNSITRNPELENSAERFRRGAPSRASYFLQRIPVLLRAQSGQAITEFAIVVPILLTIVFGIIDFGRAINYQNDETHVANLAARYAAVGALPTYGACGTNTLGANATLTAFIDCQLGLDSGALVNGSGGGNGPSAVSVCISIPSDTQFNPVTVKLTTQYQWLPFLKLSTSSISGTATQEIENAPSSSLVTGAQTTPC
jgi:Flp pilus assembly protein TadG